MAQSPLSDEQFHKTWHSNGCSATAVSDTTGVGLRAVYARRKRLSDQGWHLPTTPAPGYENRVPEEFRTEDAWTFPREKRLWLDTGVVVVSSDHHYWPGEATVAHKALLAVIRKVKPRVKILNGDIFDGISVSRHPPFGWSARPTVVQELSACQERVGEIEQAIPKGCERLWNIGNHCIRFERTLATQASDYAGVPGTRLADHFPGWEMQWSTLINPENPHPVMVKHRFRAGIHAGYNNALHGGMSIVTGHTHNLEAKPIADYRGRRWGVQTGTVADLEGPAFEYTENAPSHACAGFVVLTFKDGKMLSPELCEVVDGKAYFRGEVVA